MSARCEKALIEGGPQRFFGDFLIAQKVTSPLSPAGRNLPLIAQKGTSAPVSHDNGEARSGRSNERGWRWMKNGP